MTAARGALGAAVVMALAGCRDGRADLRPGEPPEDAGAPFAATPWDASRPARTHYLGNRDGRCLLYWTEGARRSPSSPVLCPREIGPGEQVRLAGSVCLREAASAARSVPIRCPLALVQAAYGRPEPK
jgi:hypothetical protein